MPLSRNVFTRCELALRLVAPEVGRVSELGQHDLVAVRQMRQELVGRRLRGRRTVEVPPIRSVGTFDVCTRLYWLSLAFDGHARRGGLRPR